MPGAGLKREGGRRAWMPSGAAITFGARRTLIEEGNKRIYQNPGQSASHIYGEQEVGGTGYLYLSEVPFDR